MPFSTIEDPVKLRRVLEAMLLVESELDRSAVLRHVVDEARAMTGARYAALGVLNEDRTALADFLTAGLEPEEQAAIGHLPVGLGVLGLLIVDPKPIRLARLDAHPDSYGFPPHHPPMSSFLGVPIKVRDEVYGNLYLTDKTGWSEFTSDDEALVVALALAAGIAIEHAELHQRAEQVAIGNERDRLARDLHDTVIQRLFAVGLSLQSAAGAPMPAQVSERLGAAVAEIDDTIRQIRMSIFGLSMADTGRRSARAEVVSLVDDLRAVVGTDIAVAFDGPVDTALTGEVTDQVLAVCREALTNVGRHAGASSVGLSLTVSDGRCRLAISDDGRGLDTSGPRTGGLGLANMRRRAEKLRGSFDIGTVPDGGTVVTWEVPLPS